MTNSQRLAIVRAHLVDWICAQEGIEQESDSPITSESILIREGHFCGRSFKAKSHRAVWFIEEDELKIHDLDGALVVAFKGDEIGDDSDEQQSDTASPAIIKMDSPQPEDKSGDVRRAA